MKKITTSLFILFFLISSLSVNAQTTYSFSDFDYPEESVIYGSRNKVSYFIPINEFTLSQGSQLELHVKVSEVLDAQNSFVTVAVGGIPLATKSPKRDNSIIDFKVSLEPRYATSGFFRIDIITSLKINKDLCEIYSEGAYWVRRLPSSTITLNTDEERAVSKIPEDISAFIPMVNKLVLPAKPSLETLSFASYIQFYFKRELLIDLEVMQLDLSKTQNLDRAIILGKTADLPAERLSSLQAIELTKDQGLVLLDIEEETAENGASELQRSLVITGKSGIGLEKSAKILLNDDILKSAFTKQIKVNDAKELVRGGSLQRFGNVSFKELGVDEELIEGIGKLSREITLPRSVFGSDLKEMELELSFKYRPLKTSEDAYANIYLDGVLKHSHALNNSGEANETINFNHLDIKKSNVLKIEFYYIPEGGMCVDNPAMFYAQLNLDRSVFKAKSYFENPDLSFFYFPENFQDKKIQLFLNPEVKGEQVTAISKLINQINPAGRKSLRPIFPEILPLDSLELNEEGSTNKIIISNDLGPYQNLLSESGYLKVEKNNFLYENEELGRLFNINYADKIGFNQLFQHKQNSVMFIYNPGDSTAILSNLINQIEGQSLSNTGNVILASPEKSYFFDLAAEKDNVSQEELETGFSSYWEKYRIFIVFALFVLMVVVLIYVFQKSQESKNNIVNEK